MNRRSSGRRISKSASRSPHRRLGLERLESRVVLDGNVHAFVSGGNLHIDGDSAANDIVITQTGSNTFQIDSGTSATTINGGAGPVTLTAKHNMIINMKAGDDVVHFDGTTDPITIHGRLIANMGSGDDQLLMEGVALRGMTIDMGNGNDTLNLGADGSSDGVTSSKFTLINMGSGTDDARIANSIIYRMLLNMSSGNDKTTIQGTTFRKRSTADGGPGNDTVNRQDNPGRIKYISYETSNNTVTSPAPIPPTASGDSATVDRGGSLAINVASNDSAASGQTLNLGSIVITQQPAHGTATPHADGTVTYTNDGNAATSDSFKYTIKDNAGTVSSPATVSITVGTALAAVNDAATIANTAVNPTITTLTGGGSNLLTNDTGGTGNKTISAVNGSAANVGTNVAGANGFGTFKINADGTFSYTLTESNATVSGLPAGQTLTDTATYTVKDQGGGASTATLTVTITSVAV